MEAKLPDPCQIIIFVCKSLLQICNAFFFTVTRTRDASSFLAELSIVTAGVA